MTTRRRYDQGCGTAHALDLIGDRWALLVVRELLLGPKRFTDLREGLPGIGPNVLSQRLKELEDAGVVRQRVLPPPAASSVYELTAWGSELEPIVIQLGRWGARSPSLPAEVDTQPEWLILGLRATYAPEGQPPPLVYELHLDDEVFWARPDDGALSVGRGPASDPDAILTSEPETLVRMIRGAITPAAAVRSGALKVEGDRKAFERFLTLFRFPPPAP